MGWFRELFQKRQGMSGPGTGTGKLMRAVWKGQVIAESDQTVVVEGNHYFPSESVCQEFIVKSSTTTSCIWKGMANYYSLNVDGEINPDAAWFYVEPKKAAKEIKGKVAFWHGVKISSSET
jgi:uncharacterized protein (DUF427 family)